MPWEVNLVEEVTHWYEALWDNDPNTAELVTSAIDLLEERGPALGRPLVDTIEGSTIKNLKELRPGSSGSSEIRILFAFDHRREAVLLVAGDKAGEWKRWYQENISVAEFRFESWLNAINSN